MAGALMGALVLRRVVSVLGRSVTRRTWREKSIECGWLGRADIRDQQPASDRVSACRFSLRRGSDEEDCRSVGRFVGGRRGVGAEAAAVAGEKCDGHCAGNQGETGKRNLEGIARFHRQRGSQGFHAVAELLAERLRAYGFSDVAILEFPADGKIFYGT